MVTWIDSDALAVVTAAGCSDDFGEDSPLVHVLIKNQRAYGADGYMMARADLIDLPDGSSAFFCGTEPDTHDGDVLLPIDAVNRIRDEAWGLEQPKPGIAWIDGNLVRWHGVASGAQSANLQTEPKPIPYPSKLDELFTERSTVEASTTINPELMERAFKIAREFLGDDCRLICRLSLNVDPIQPQCLTPVLHVERPDGRVLDVLVMPLYFQPDEDPSPES